MIGEFIGYKVFVESRVPPNLRIGHRAIVLTPREAVDLASGKREMQIAVIEEIKAYELSRVAA
jgi:DNA-binding CsgD family transcriptional regulator